MAASVPPAAREFRVTVLSGGQCQHNETGNDHPPKGSHGNRNMNGQSDHGAAKPAGFQSLESQRTVALGSAGGREKKIGEPRVSIQRDGDRVTHLRIQCPCGQIMDLACVYDAPALG